MALWGFMPIVLRVFPVKCPEQKSRMPEGSLYETAHSSAYVGLGLFPHLFVSGILQERCPMHSGTSCFTFQAPFSPALRCNRFRGGACACARAPLSPGPLHQAFVDLALGSGQSMLPEFSFNMVPAATGNAGVIQESLGKPRA